MRSRYRPTTVALGVVIVLAIAAAVIVGLRASRSTEAVPPDRPGPVLLVPGRSVDSDALVALQRRLFLSGRRAIIVSLGDSGGDLRAQAREIQATAERMVAAGSPSVDVVGYAAGGLVTRLWLADGGAALARRVVMIATPNQGVTGDQVDDLVTARFCAVTCPQLAPGGPVLSALPAPDLPAPARPAPWLNLWTARDRVVSSASAHLPRALNVSLQSVCADDRSDHVEIGADPLLIGIVLKAVAPEALTSAPTGADCSALRDAGSPDELPDLSAAN